MTAALRWPARRDETSRALTSIAPLSFRLPDELAATEPPEARGLRRDAVRLMVSRVANDSIEHAIFRDLPAFLSPKDVVVVNASATINAALDAWRMRAGGKVADRVALHLSSPIGDGTRWVVELRRLTARGTAPLLDARIGERFMLATGATARLVAPFVTRVAAAPVRDGVRLWVADLVMPEGVIAFAARYGRPIQYAYVRDRWSLDSYQTIFSTDPGSAEMPSAGRPFSREVVDRLEGQGTRVVPLVLHTGVASLESHEAPYPERYRVPASTVDAVNAARAAGGRVIAVGTTVVRALETVASPDGTVQAGEGWTDLVITPDRGVRAVDAIVTGFHEPMSSHLSMLEALAGRRHLALAYEAALRERYRWHEFGDSHLILRSKFQVPGSRFQGQRCSSLEPGTWNWELGIRRFAHPVSGRRGVRAWRGEARSGVVGGPDWRGNLAAASRSASRLARGSSHNAGGGL